ncbi:MAG TPA: NAD(P)-dependent oxidoreductase, partial [Deltaproteobacteria bacterium]|nr:NAD(P)-dependent oxidoreductase [Deltaproteobacteria bacterium]
MQSTGIGWIGTGVMGAAMCSHLLKAGHHVSVFTRTREKASGLLEAGATWCDSPGEASRAADVVFTMVGFPDDVEEVYFSGQGILNYARRGAILIDMTTSRPSLARKIYLAAREKGCRSLDAPVSGGDIGARLATLAIMAGGDPDSFEEAMPLLKLLGRTVSLMGGPGSGQHTKMANQIAIASTMVGVVEALLYARKAGLDPEGVIDVIGTGAAASWSMNTLGRRMLKHDMEPGFFIKHFVKDLAIALDEARSMGLALPGLALA